MAGKNTASHASFPAVRQTDVLIIGGGATGMGIARDMALRGVRCIVAEWRDVAGGASGANHGLLHSGARYVKSDREAAAECLEEGKILRRTAGHCIEDTGGLFVAVDGDDLSYAEAFPSLCAAAGIPALPVDVKDALEMEPALSKKLVRAFQVPDGSLDPFRLCLDLMAHAESLVGSEFLPNTRILGLEIKNNRIVAAKAEHPVHGAFRIEAKEFVNAAGAWSAGIAAMAGADVPLVYSKGTLLVTHDRLAKRAINRLRPSGDGDILVPGGTVSVLGTTSIRLKTLDAIVPTVEEVETNIREGAPMVPALATTRYIRCYAGVRPLAGSGDADRAVSRNFSVIDHARPEWGGIQNMVTITGGKLTTFRLMAEKTSNLVSEKLGIAALCRTRDTLLPSVAASSWTEPGRAAKAWLSSHGPDDPVLCECEMVQKKAVMEILASLPDRDALLLNAIGLRSRVGKGPCQGAFCSARITSAFYDDGIVDGTEGLDQLIAFLRSRFKGQKPILWGTQMAQAELSEALHCGLFSFERLACKGLGREKGESNA
ncbi:Glycerol-3-phosphate dehydrogenase [uncultured delta proteobacterium]|uniref:Glycerol-3-phosphate dehydrogenase n=1 Tax=uncultured delta proteobacterium TaxID=34034 RepID=A0A212J6T3_9DELT|nr:Glycerol-3-phosphate dehydrogenase [uncultured delta proteobacterium]